MSSVKKIWSGYTSETSQAEIYKTEFDTLRSFKVDISDCTNINKISINIIGTDASYKGSYSLLPGLIGNIDKVNKKITFLSPTYATSNTWGSNGLLKGTLYVLPMYYEIIEFM